MITRVYLKSAVFLLLLTAGGKLLMGFGKVPVLEKAAPFFSFISNRTLLFIAVGLEVGVAMLILSGYRGRHMGLTAVGSLAALFLSFRLLLWVTGFQGYCGCLGSLSDVLHLAPREADRVATGILVYFLVGSCGFRVAGLWSKRDCKELGNSGADNFPPKLNEAAGRCWLSPGSKKT